MRRPEAAFASPSSASVAADLGRAIRLARLGRNLPQAASPACPREPRPLQRIERGDPAVSFTSWLSAMEASGLLPALKAVADPGLDALGVAQRQREERKRATGTKRQADRDDAYDF